MLMVQKIWTRLTGSKVAWMALPMAIAQVWLAISGQNISREVDIVFTSLWSVLSLFLTVNNPDDPNAL